MDLKEIAMQLTLKAIESGEIHKEPAETDEQYSVKVVKFYNYVLKNIALR